MTTNYDIIPKTGEHIVVSSAFEQYKILRAAGFFPLTGLAVTRNSSSQVDIASGTYSNGGINKSYVGGSLSAISAAAAGKQRYDLVVIDGADDTAKLIAGTEATPEDTSNFLENHGPYPPSVTAGAKWVVLAIVRVTESGIEDSTFGTYATGSVAMIKKAGYFAVDDSTLTVDSNGVLSVKTGNGAGQALILDGSGLVPLADLPSTLTGKDADTLDGSHAAAFPLLAGRAGGTTIYGGTASGDDLTLAGTSNGSNNGDIILNPSGGKVGVCMTPSYPLDVNGQARFSGEVGVCGTVPNTLYPVYMSRDYTDPISGNVGIYLLLKPTFTGVETASESLNASQFSAFPIINTGHVNSGNIRGIMIQSTRNQNGASADDSGTLSNLFGADIHYGHFNTNGAATPITTNVYGMRLLPYLTTGTITNLYDLFISSGSTGGTVTNRYGIYQESASANNYFAGNIGIGMVPSYPFDVTGNVRISGNLGLLGTAPGINSKIYAAPDYTDPATYTRLMYMWIKPTYTGAESASETVIATQIDNTPIINAGHTNSGSQTSLVLQNFRNLNGASADDGGSLTTLSGMQINYGHSNTNAAATPSTTNVFGVYLNPYGITGTITNLYDIFITAGSTGGTITNRWSIYQESSAARNYFNGNIGLGTTDIEAWATPYKSIEWAGCSVIGGPDLHLSENAYYDAGGWKYKATAAATRYYQAEGLHRFNVVVSGSANDAITWNDALNIANSGGVCIGGSTDPGNDNLYVVGNCSALSFTDRTPAYTGDALAEIRAIKKTSDGSIDHETLPTFARAKLTLDNDGEIKEEEGRDIGNMVSVLTVAVQQLLDKIDSIVEERNKKIDDAVEERNVKISSLETRLNNGGL